MSTLTQDEYDTLFFCAFRYALGRKTYITGVVSELIRDHLDLISTDFKVKAAADLDRAISSGFAGMQCDVAEWLKLRAMLGEDNAGKD